MRLARGLKGSILCAGLVVAQQALALDPARRIAQYKHTRWTSEDGAPASVLSLAQRRDGYLWIGARDGLYRFDGISFERISVDRPHSDRIAVSSLMVARDGSVWVGYSAGGVEVYRGGRLRDAGVPNATAYVMGFAQTADGTVWAELGGVFPHLMRYRDGRWEAVAASWGLPREHPIDLIAARDGTLWLTTLQSVFFLRPGNRRFERMPARMVGHAALSEDASGRIWIADAAGARILTGETPTRFPYPTPPAPRAVQTFFDRDGNLWGMTGLTGIFRVASPKVTGEASPGAAAAQVERFGERDRLTSDNTSAILEDREGNIWVGSSLGLDRFRAASVVVEPLLTTPAGWGDVLLGAADGSVYVGEADRFYRIRPGGSPEPLVSGAGEAEAVCEGPSGNVWMITAQSVFRFQNSRLTSLDRPASVGVMDDCAVDGSGTLWITASEGAFRQTGSGWQLQSIPGGEDRDTTPMTAGRDGSLFVPATARSLMRIDYPRISNIVVARPRALRDLRTIYAGTDGLLLGGRFGLARLRDRRAEFVGANRVPAFASLTGIVQTPAGETWLMGSRGISRARTAELDRAFTNPRSPLAVRTFDTLDGLPGFNVRDGRRDAVRGGDGRLWFGTTAGTVWVDPARIARNLLPPPVAIAALRAGGTSYRDPVGVTLPRGTSAAEIDFAALSLSIPERVQVRYRLEGADADWVDPGMRRQAFYTNLGAGTYRFRVIAANDDGVWNRDGATLEFTIPPTFVQSNWFVLLGLLGVGALLWLAYSMRVRQLTSRARSDLMIRVTERERIARELHDTLLQSFQGLVLRFQAVAERIPTDQPLRPIVDQALDRADSALVEGRERVRELRAAGGDLAQALIDTAEQLAADSTTRFNLTVEGHPRELHPMVRDEVQHIGVEAIRNAFRHASAREVEAVLTYRARELRLELRDDGSGIPAGLAAGGGREGHYGLTGMRERAARIGGTLAISSRKDAGTEVRLSVPARTAYVVRPGRWRLSSPLARRRRA